VVTFFTTALMKLTECIDSPNSTFKPSVHRTTCCASLQNNCRATCVFHDPATGNTYDLTALQPDGTITVMPSSDVIDTLKYLSYEISLCDKFVSDDCAVTECTENSYVFGEFGDEKPRIPRTLGTWFEFVPVAIPPVAAPPVPSDIQADVSSHTFDIQYTRGNNLPKECTQVTTTIQFFCLPNEGKGLPVATSFETKCTTTFVWKSLYGCKICTKNDEVEEEGPCINGMRTRVIRYNTPCYEKEPTVPVTEPCQDFEVARTTVILAVSTSTLLLGAGVGCAIYFFQQKRKIEVKYDLLRNEATVDEQEDEVL